jgi:GGDEF domain-containing protein
MNARNKASAQATAGSSADKPESPSIENRTLMRLIDGVAANAPQIDAEALQTFHGKVARLSQSVPDTLPELDKIVVIDQVVREFERYRIQTENSVKARVAGWRALAGDMLRELIRRMNLEPSSPGVSPLIAKIGFLATVEEIAAYRQLLDEFLHPPEAPELDLAATLKVTDRSTANDNATGLHGGGSAIEHLRGLMQRGKKGFVVHFRLGCLEIISQRFGMEAVEDCLMAVSSYLTDSLHAEDKIYHWSDSSLLVVAQGRVNRQILESELGRIVSLNKNINIQIGGRTVMLRIPLEYDITPISSFREAEDLERFYPGPEIAEDEYDEE